MDYTSIDVSITVGIIPASVASAIIMQMLLLWLSRRTTTAFRPL